MRGWSHLKDYLEELCIRRFQANASRGKAALDEVIERICGETKGQLKDLLRDATGIPLQDMSGPEARSVSPSIAADAAAYLD